VDLGGFICDVSPPPLFFFEAEDREKEDLKTHPLNSPCAGVGRRAPRSSISTFPPAEEKKKKWKSALLLRGGVVPPSLSTEKEKKKKKKQKKKEKKKKKKNRKKKKKKDKTKERRGEKEKKKKKNPIQGDLNEKGITSSSLQIYRRGVRGGGVGWGGAGWGGGKGGVGGGGTGRKPFLPFPSSPKKKGKDSLSILAASSKRKKRSLFPYFLTEGLTGGQRRRIKN